MRLRELLVPKKQLALVWGQYTEKINPNEGTNTMRAELGGEDPPWAKARHLKKLASLPATSSVLSTHSGWLTMGFNSSSSESNALFWPLYSCVYAHGHTCAHTDSLKKIIRKALWAN